MSTYADHGIDIPYDASGEVRTLCPECSPHRKKTSEKCLAVNTEKETWFCHHCGHSGGLKKERDPEPVIIRPKFKKSELPQAVVEWFQKRGIPEHILAANQISYGKSFKDKNGIQFPYFKGGVTVNVKHRAHDKDFRQEKNAEKCLYRFDEIAKCKGNTLILTEGEMDTLSFQAAGFEMVASIPDGAPSANAKSFNSKFDFLKSAENILKHYKKIILAVDNDPPGKAAEQELARRIGAEKCFRVRYPAGCKDANDALMKHGKAAVIALVEQATPYPVEGLLSPMDYENEVLSLYDLGPNRGISTGWQTLDEHYTVKPGEMTIITGIPGSGKSNFVDALMVNIVRSLGWSFAIFSPENWPPERHIQTLLEKVEGKPFATNGRHEQRMTREDVQELLGIINQHFFFIVPPEDLLTVETILEKARAAIFRHGVKGVVLDPWNEIDHLYNGQTEAQYLSEKLTKIRRFARMNGVHVWIVAHPKNLVKDASTGSYKPPTMYEISGGAHWRNKADNGICIHRPDYSNDITEVYIQKIRFKEVGKPGDIELRYCRDSGTYSEENIITKSLMDKEPATHWTDRY